MACRSFLWDDLMNYVAEKKAALLDICGDASTTNRVRACQFETMVIRRCASNLVTFQVGQDSITIPAARAIGFSGTLLPHRLPTDGLYYPEDPNFPAIAFISKHRREVFAFQVHVSNHDDVTSNFTGMCAQAD
eukprot:CAMPEP_0119029694 /NCGR_PEP_ID=MMETSP1176-20130426/40651_1 /TAXON_ID=265551 /ORGANISM="Synedropsis recta cf, Strain CCMP1620" /LENGTH=132 /DNA_ID=CAMNT_0006986045 /DNA_START=80 /DNA_END=478 /DNA_ORIENTATION=-